jgi:hypothetical protein
VEQFFFQKIPTGGSQKVGKKIAILIHPPFGFFIKKNVP